MVRLLHCPSTPVLLLPPQASVAFARYDTFKDWQHATFRRSGPLLLAVFSCQPLLHTGVAQLLAEICWLGLQGLPPLALDGSIGSWGSTILHSSSLTNRFVVFMISLLPGRALVAVPPHR